MAGPARCSVAAVAGGDRATVARTAAVTEWSCPVPILAISDRLSSEDPEGKEEYEFRELHGEV